MTTLTILVWETWKTWKTWKTSYGCIDLSSLRHWTPAKRLPVAPNGDAVPHWLSPHTQTHTETHRDTHTQTHWEKDTDTLARPVGRPVVSSTWFPNGTKMKGTCVLLSNRAGWVKEENLKSILWRREEDDEKEKPPKGKRPTNVNSRRKKDSIIWWQFIQQLVYPNLPPPPPSRSHSRLFFRLERNVGLQSKSDPAVERPLSVDQPK